MSIKKILTPFLFVVLIISLLIIDQAKAAVSVPTINRDLSVGSTGADVKSLQQFLNDNGYIIAPSGAGSKGKETNMFGYATKNALIKFQAANGVTATGYLGEKTRAVLNALANKKGATVITPNTATITNTTTTNTLATENESLKKDNAALQALITSLQAKITTLTAKQTELETYINNFRTSVDSNDGAGPDIVSIVVVNDGDDNYIDNGDSIKITFDEAINPTTINKNLSNGGSVSGVAYSDVAGISVSSSGKVTIRNIASFDMGSVENSRNFTSRIALSSSGKILTITITSGSDVRIASENFSGAAQLNGIVEDLSGNIMTSISNACTPTGSFGGDVEEEVNDDSDGDGPVISSIYVSDGGNDGYIDIGDSIKINFDRAIDPNSISSSLKNGGYINNVFPSEVGGVSVTSAGKILIKGVNIFDMGSVRNAGEFVSRVALSSSGKTLTITITGGSVEITNESFSGGNQVSGSIKDLEGDVMDNISSVSPTGTFGGAND